MNKYSFYRHQKRLTDRLRLRENNKVERQNILHHLIYMKDWNTSVLSFLSYVGKIIIPVFVDWIRRTETNVYLEPK